MKLLKNIGDIIISIIIAVLIAVFVMKFIGKPPAFSLYLNARALYSRRAIETPSFSASTSSSLNVPNSFSCSILGNFSKSIFLGALY